MSIQNLILGNLVSQGADRLLNPNRKNVASIDKFISGGGIGQESEEKDKGPTTFGGIAKQGIMSLIAQAILGPVFGPLALTLGQNFVDKKKQGLGFFEKPGDPTTQPQDIRGTFTAEGMQFENIQDALGSTDPNKDINYNTGVITDKTTGKDIGNVYDEVALTNVPAPPAYDFDDSGSDSGSSGGSSSASTAGDAPGYSGPSTFRYGGLASLYR
jgi:hypothetical protein